MKFFKAIFSTLFLLFAAALTLSARQRDISLSSSLMDRLDEYLSAMDHLGIAQAQAEADFVIESVQDSLLREKVAAKVYEHFRDSGLMGSENVAVWIFDKWYATFRVLFDDVDDFEAANVHAYVNRSSLIGRKAPRLTLPLVNPSSRKDSVTIVKKHRRSIIYFYSTSCPKCLVTSLSLRDYLNSHRVKVNVYAIYTGDNPVEAEAYTANELKIANNCSTKFYSLYGGDVDYVVPYGVVQTPRLFLVDRKGIVAGRHLDVAALEKLLQTVR